MTAAATSDGARFDLAPFDVAVVGGGPAGCAAAVVAARAGLRVVLVERSGYDTARVGDTLPPEVGPLLERLGAWDGFCAGGHLRSPGILAAWGGPDPAPNDFIVNPHGPGWRVDRARFDEMLAGVAGDAGVEVRRHTEVVGCGRDPSGAWVLDARSGGGGARRICAGVVVDAAGAVSPLRRRLGGRQVVHDRLVGLTAVLAPDAGGVVEDRRTLIEATRHGWWYSGPLPDGRLALIFHTDPAPGWRQHWSRHLAAAPHTAARVGGRAPTGLRLVAAGSRRRHPAATGTWLATGDAAAAHDPLSGLGIYRALESGTEAGEAIVARAGGDPGAVDAYAEAVRVRFEEYLDRRATYYRAEQRWPDAPFWRRRHGTALPVLPADR